jgi:UrcA family protein
VLVLPAALRVADASAAVTAQDAASVTVGYYDLNLNNPQGVSSLYQRIRGAAREVCGSFEGREGLEQQVRLNGCLAEAVANAVRAVHNDALSAYHWRQVRPRKAHENDAPTSVATR